MVSMFTDMIGAAIEGQRTGRLNGDSNDRRERGAARSMASWMAHALEMNPEASGWVIE